jgi:hypothetical protein
LRLLAGSALGVGCILLAQRLQPAGGSPFAAPSGPVAWTALTCGIAGIWLVPGLWLSAVMMRTGRGPVAWLATRIGTTLAWYALVGHVVYLLAQGALVTTGDIVGPTAGATAAVCLGVALGLLPRLANTTLRIDVDGVTSRGFVLPVPLGAVVGAVAGGVGAQIGISLLMRLKTYDMNYEHIVRLHWLIVLGCALLTTVGIYSRPELPSVRAARHMRKILVFNAVVAITAMALVAVGARWSPEQRMPSAFGAEQVPEPAGADLAFALTAIGPDGSRLIQHALFTASDDEGRPVDVRTRLVVGNPTADRATLLVMLEPSSRPALCGRTVGDSEQGTPVKLTMRDQASGVLIQALIPAGWCAR